MIESSPDDLHTAPEASDLGSFAELEVGSADLALWKKHLVKTCEQNAYFKQTLTSALIIVVNSSECEWILLAYNHIRISACTICT